MSDAELVQRVAESTGLTLAEAGRVVDDVLFWHDETVEEFVRRRHQHHQVFGKRNPEIFRLVGEELRSTRFAAPHLSERQLRRIVYG